MDFKTLTLGLKLARRELRSGLSGFYIFLMCLILGVFSISAILTVSASLKDSLRHDGRLILGGDIALRTSHSPATEEQITYLRHEIGPTTVTTETHAMARRADESDAMLIELKAVDPFYPIYGSVKISDGAGTPITDEPVQSLILPGTIKNPKEWGAAVEPEVLTRLNLELGDYIFIGQKKFQLRAVIDHEPDRMSGRRFGLAPRIMISSYIFDETGLSSFGAQIYYDHKILTPYVKNYEDLEVVQKKITDAFPTAQWRGRNFTNASPRVERYIDRLTMFLSFIGLTALLVGGIGVSNAVHDFLERRTPTIATLKCLGASEKLIATTYLLQIFGLALVGIFIGLLLGSGLPFLLAPLLTEKLGLSNQMGLYPHVWGIATGFGLLTTLCFSLWPLGKSCQTPGADLFRKSFSLHNKRPRWPYLVAILCAGEGLAALAIFTSARQDMAVWFVVGSLASIAIFLSTSVFVKYLAKTLFKPRSIDLHFAFTNLYRPGNVTNGILLSLGLGMTVLIMIGLIENSFSNMLHTNIAKETPSFFFLDIQNNQIDPFTKIIEDTPDTRNLKVTASLRGRIVLVNGIDAEKAFKNNGHRWVLSGDRGFTYAKDMPVGSEMIEGQWWTDADIKQAQADKTPLMSIATDVAEAFDIGIGDTITVNILGADITGRVFNVREIDWGSFGINFAMTFSPGVLDKMPAAHIATVEINEDGEEALQTTLAKTFPNVTTIRVKEALDMVTNILTHIAQAVRASTVITVLSGLLVLAGGIAAGQSGRIYDSTVLKVLGISKRRILKIYMFEYGLLGVMTSIVAGVIGTIAAWALCTYILELKWFFDPMTILYISMLCLVITLIFGLFGTSRALNHKSAHILRNE